MHFIKKQLHIEGMSCVGCQTKIQQALLHTDGITEATVNYNTGKAQITYDAALLSWSDILLIIEDLGYEVLPEETNQTEKREKPNWSQMKRTTFLLVLILALYMLLEQSGILNRLVPSQLADSEMSYGFLFVIGLITSVHCIAMCGGINLSQCIPKSGTAVGTDSPFSVFLPSFLYNLGRIISYTAAGFILGTVGMLFGGDSTSGISVMFQGILKLIAGFFMVLMGLNMLNLFPALRPFHLRLPKSLTAKITAKKLRERRPLAVGLLNGLMPCGPLQSMQIVALASGNPFSGALSMFLFSLGTVPLMLGFGSLVSLLGKRFAKNVMNIGAILVVVLGLAMFSQGGSLSGFLLPDRLLLLLILASILGIAASIPFCSPARKSAVLTAIAAVIVFYLMPWNPLVPAGGRNSISSVSDSTNVIDGVQVINSTLTPGKYPTITVQAGIPVKWVIDAPAGSINGCNYKMLLQEYQITHTFTQGENIIEFTPTKTGTIPYSCWMGMIRGNIFVTDADNTQTASSDSSSINVPIPSGYQIPSDTLAVAQLSRDESGNEIQEVSITLTDEGFVPAVIVAEANLPVIWNIHVSLSDAADGTLLLAPFYSTKLNLLSGENSLYLYPQESFEVSTEDHRFYAYVKVVEDIEQIDETAIQEEVSMFEPLIYPDIIFETAGMSCCS